MDVDNDVDKYVHTLLMQKPAHHPKVAGGWNPASLSERERIVA
jgi:hypothetical protein